MPFEKLRVWPADEPASRGASGLVAGVEKVHWQRRGWERWGCDRNSRPRRCFAEGGTRQLRHRHPFAAIALLAALLLVTIVSASVAQAASPADSRQIAADILSSSRYQTKLPGEVACPSLFPNGPGGGQGKDDPSTGPQSNDSGNAADSGPNPSIFTAIMHGASPALAAILHYLPAVLLTGLGIALVAFGVWRFSKRRRATAAEETAPVLPATVSQPAKPAPLPAWQKLAEQERFDEAIHLLLLQTLQHLRQERAIALQESQTSREILRSGTLQAQRRAGLATMIGAVEFCHFGGRPAGAQLFEHCFAAYQQIIGTTVENARPA